MSTIGKIRTGATEYVVYCGNRCGMYEVDHTYTKKLFAKHLRKHGWKTSFGLWICEKCLEGFSKET